VSRQSPEQLILPLTCDIATGTSELVTLAEAEAAKFPGYSFASSCSITALTVMLAALVSVLAKSPIKRVRHVQVAGHIILLIKLANPSRDSSGIVRVFPPKALTRNSAFIKPSLCMLFVC